MSQRHVLSIDVEENWQGEYARLHPSIVHRYISNTNVLPILKTLKTFDATATFFVVGECVSDSTLSKIIDAGHEIGFHTADHVPLFEKRAEQFREEVREFKARVKHVTGTECVGFRAPSFSLSRRTSWAVDILREEGYRYDSSIFPVRTLLYNGAGAPLKPYELDSMNPFVEGHSSVLEFPLTTYSFLRQGIPMAGGFYLRAVPFALISRGLKRLVEHWGVSLVLYVHNWEMVPSRPPDGLAFLPRFYTSFNTHNVMSRIVRLLSKFRFSSFRDGYFRSQH